MLVKTAKFVHVVIRKADVELDVMFAEDARCHQCQRRLRFARPITGDRGPQAGDPILCGHCGAINYLAEDGHTQIPSEADMRRWQGEPGKWRILRQFQSEIINGPGSN